MSVMKKVVSVALALCLVLSCAAIAFAEENAALSVKILSVPELQAGAAISGAQVEYEISEGFVAETLWYVWNDEESYVPAEGAFDANSVYYLELKITAQEGHTLPEEFEFESLVNPDYLGYGTEYDDAGNPVFHTIDLGYHTLTTIIDTVEVTVAEVAVGGAPAVESVKLYSGETELPAEIAQLSVVWYSLMDNYDEMTGSFEANKVYQIQAELRAAAGYSFADDTVVYLNGEDQTGFNYPTYLEFFKDYSLREPIHSFEISGMPKFEAGVEFRDVLKLESEYENCELTAYWMDEEWKDVEENAFVAGKTYILQIEAYSYGYELLAEDFVFVIDGETYQPKDLEETQAFLEMTVYIPEPADPDMPPTGDPFLPLLWAVLAVAALAGTVVLVKTKR